MKSLLGLILASALAAQTYSPKVLRSGQPDPTDLRAFAAGICDRASAKTPRAKAEAIWRYFLTDGRFVKPGFWYHIAGWAYEEPMGEVLDPLKLLNSYGFGLCYHIAPLLEAVWEAAGFEDARVWFLTGHTVAEVFYDGSYHYFDSDMMGYTPAEPGSFRTARVASVRDMERRPDLLLKRGTVDEPWYPADVQANAMDGLAALFSTTSDNWVFPFRRYPEGHSMDFVLRPGETMTRYFRPVSKGAYYLPYEHDGRGRKEFPREIAQYKIRTEDGPRSQKDQRLWATGLLTYRPPSIAPEYQVVSPYVIIDASFAATLAVGDGQSVTAESSADGGKTWQVAGKKQGPYHGRWSVPAAVTIQTEHGKESAVSGVYRYVVRFRGDGVSSVQIDTLFQVNPRSLPALQPGANEFRYTAGPPIRRRVVPVTAARFREYALLAKNAAYIGDSGEGYVIPKDGGTAEIVYEVAAGAGFDAGGRFLDLHDGIAPEKRTAETRKVAPLTDAQTEGSIAWSTSPNGPFTPLWEYAPPEWRDGQPVDRMLRWPEVDRAVRHLPPGTKKVYVRYRARGLAIDDFRMAGLESASPASGGIRITHVWRAGGVERRHVETIERSSEGRTYTVRAGDEVENTAIVYEAITPQ